MTAIMWFDALTSQRQSAFSIPHFTFHIPQFHILPIIPAANGWQLSHEQVSFIYLLLHHMGAHCTVKYKK